VIRLKPVYVVIEEERERIVKMCASHMECRMMK